MGSGVEQPVVLDTTVLSNFAASRASNWLFDFIERPAVAPAVRQELERGQAEGHAFLADAIDCIRDLPPVPDANPTESGDRTLAPRIRDSLDSGEAESLYLARERGGTLATDDLAARRLASEAGIPVTGSIGLLVVGIRRGELDVATADDWLEAWRTERGYYSPVGSLDEAIDVEEP